MKRLENIIDDIRAQLKEGVDEAVRLGYLTAYAVVKTKDGFIEASVHKSTEIVKILIGHNNVDNECECPALCKYLEEQFKEDYFWYDYKKGHCAPAWDSWNDYLRECV